MAGNIRTVIVKINKACDEVDFVSARILIEGNIKQLSEGINYRQLNSNAQILIKHVLSDHTGDSNKLSRTEMLTIHNINQYCSEFNISMLKRTLKNSLVLKQREDVAPLLNKDAKIILENMGVLFGVPQMH